MVVIGRVLSLLRHSSCKVGRWIPPGVVALSSSGHKLRSTDFQCTVPIFRQAIAYGDSTAIQDVHGRYGYHGLLESSCRFARDVSQYLEGRRQQRVALLCPRDASHVVAQWACWISGQVVVPLPDDVPLPVLQHYVIDSGADLVITTRQHAKVVAKLCLMVGSKLLILEHVLLEKAREGQGAMTLHTIGLDADYYDRDDAIIIYTVGSTGMAQGSLLSHQAIQAEVSALVRSWQLSEGDCLLHLAPLHHVSGNVDMLACPLVVGAACVMLPKCEAIEVWSQLLYNEEINILLAPPSMYTDLIQEYDKSLKDKKENIRSALTGKIRLMMSDRAALPPAVMQRWQEISGHVVVESHSLAQGHRVVETRA